MVQLQFIGLNQVSPDPSPIHRVKQESQKVTQRQEAGMSVMVDHERLEVERLGLRTVGQVLSHLQRDNRLVVNLLIDGREPDLDRIGVLRQSPLADHTLFIETAEPHEMALEVLDEVENQLDEADRLKGE